MSTLIATLGFDEKFLIKSILRHGSSLKQIVVVAAEPLDQRSINALRTVEDFTSKYLPSIRLQKVVVDPSRAREAIAKLKSLFKEAGEYIVNLSGGMRALLIELLIALTLTKPRGVLEVELENFQGVVKVPLKLLALPSLSSEEEKVLRTLVRLGRADVSGLTKMTGLPRSTLYQYLKSLKARGLIAVDREGRRAVYRPIDEAALLT